MKIAMCYTIGDGCSWHTDVVRPVVYGGVEEAAVEFERACTTAFHEKVRKFMFAGFEFDATDFFFPSGPRQEPTYFAPEFLTIDEWYNKFGA